jgi:hypothetical protein
MTKYTAVLNIADKYLGTDPEDVDAIRAMLEDRLLNVRSDYGRFDEVEIVSLGVLDE